MKWRVPDQEVNQKNLEFVQKDCQAHKLNREDAMDRNIWRKQIKMIDDQDRCELVNVSSGTVSLR